MTKIILKDISDALSIQIPHNAVPEQQAIDFYRHGNEDTTSLMTLQNQPDTHANRGRYPKSKPRNRTNDN